MKTKKTTGYVTSHFAFAATLAGCSLTVQAQDQSGPKVNTSFYGVIDVDVAEMNSGYGSKPSIGSGGFSASRLGVKIDTQVSPGIRAVALAEAGIAFDTGSVGNSAVVNGINGGYASSTAANGTGPQLFGRQIYGGIDGSLGTLTAGRQYAPSYFVSVSVGNVKNDGMYAYAGQILPAIGGMPTRVNNSILYTSPRLSGFRGQLMLTSGSENNVRSPTTVGSALTTDRSGRGVDAAIFYNLAALNVAVSGWSVENATYAATETGLARRTGLQLGVSYDFGVALVDANVVHGTIAGGNYANVTKAFSSASGWAISTLVPVGKNNFYVSYTNFNDQSQLNRDAKLYSIGYWYELSRNFRFYVSYGKVKNNANAAFSLADGGNLTGNVSRPGFSPTGEMAGVNFSF